MKTGSENGRELTIGAGLWAIGRDLMGGLAPTAAWVGDTKRVALARAEAMADYVPPDRGPETPGQLAFSRVFPHIVRGNLWNADRGYRLTRRDLKIKSKDPTIQAAGADTGIHGTHLRYLFADDVQTYDNQRISSRREHVYDQFYRKVVDRLDVDSWAWFLTNTWWDDSCDAQLVNRHGWADITLDISSINPYQHTGQLGVLSWPELHSEAVIRREMRNPMRGEVERRLWNVRMKRADSNPFKDAWIKLCYVHGLTLVPRLDTVPPGFTTFTGVDLGGFDGKSTSDQSCLFTIMLREDGIRKRRVLDIQTGRWDVHELIERLVSTHRRYKSMLIVESVGVQRAVAQMAAGRELPVRPFTTTGVNKWDPTLGVQSIAAEMAMGQWEIPVHSDGSAHPEVEAWIAELEGFDPEKHTGDRTMASWIAKMGAYEDFHGYDVGDLLRMGPGPDEQTIREAELAIANDPIWGDLLGD